MKKLFGLLIIAGMFAACGDTDSTGSDADSTPAIDNTTPELINNTTSGDAGTIENVDPSDAPIITFAESSWDFGEITQGDVVEHIFKFTNTGTSDLIITNATATCGCTVPEWTKEPIAPGAEGELRVQYNSAGKSGKQAKTVTVFANTVPNQTMLNITSTVNVPAN